MRYYPDRELGGSTPPRGFPEREKIKVRKDS